MESSDYFTATEAAAYMRLAPGTLANRRSSGDGPAYLKLGARVVYRRSDLDAWAASQRRELSPANAVLQAQAFRSYADRAGLPLPDAFTQWATSKDLSPGDRRAVWGVLSRENLARP